MNRDKSKDEIIEIYSSACINILIAHQECKQI